MRELVKVMFSLRADVVAILVRAAPKAKRSAYIAALLLAHDRAWREALNYLQGHAWTLADLHLAVDCLARSLTPGDVQAAAVREFEACGLPHFAQSCRQSGDVAHALAALADEWRLGNAELAKRLFAGVNNDAS